MALSQVKAMEFRQNVSSTFASKCPLLVRRMGVMVLRGDGTATKGSRTERGKVEPGQELASRGVTRSCTPERCSVKRGRPVAERVASGTGPSASRCWLWNQATPELQRGPASTVRAECLPALRITHSPAESHFSCSLHESLGQGQVQKRATSDAEAGGTGVACRRSDETLLHDDAGTCQSRGRSLSGTCKYGRNSDEPVRRSGVCRRRRCCNSHPIRGLLLVACLDGVGRLATTPSHWTEVDQIVALRSLPQQQPEASTRRLKRHRMWLASPCVCLDFLQRHLCWTRSTPEDARPRRDAPVVLQRRI